MSHSTTVSAGVLAAKFAGLSLPLQVLRSGAGFYIGTANETGPVSRESVEYFTTAELAERALAQGTWSQREQP
ncbi:hypothetical protein CRQ31_23500 [Salmonella enterica subsp. enterica serovar Worthington]|uniref:Uncharacterized protein n=1 Tax=Salmonella enterica subsp. enterica serovar Ank TaxID=1173578 RepID=A0A5I2X4L8_SALET|nr:hypothetical protein [Salmonella enterica]EBS1325819.1 hypothetical protein [Salmonella enterica subsp. enterica serovar Muenchen]EBY9284063.1 hypothetical protein [Salmonella enterica subsp. enterica serovar Denver]ECF3884944.1 hypothetical protein [Salmonella enterica subsp. enterica serovar Ank]EDJ9085725.1 hypothetical protein [Salmonella enterica subsp. enterica serovar Vitkin]EGI5055213.1 hypothetical protein [Salmonella enterica subsp. enterica serovar Worthington]